MDQEEEETDYIKEMREYELQREKLLIEQEAYERELELKLKSLEDARNQRLSQLPSVSVPEEEFGETCYAQADSPLKKEAAIKRKWVATDAMQNLDKQLQEEMLKKDMTFGQTDKDGESMQETQQNWNKNQKIDAKGYLQVRFAEEQPFKDEEEEFGKQNNMFEDISTGGLTHAMDNMSLKVPQHAPEENKSNDALSMGSKKYFGSIKKSAIPISDSHFEKESQFHQFQSTQGNFNKGGQTFGTGFDDRDESELSESNNELYKKHLANYYENNQEQSAGSSDLSRTQQSFNTHSEAEIDDQSIQIGEEPTKTEEPTQDEEVTLPEILKGGEYKPKIVEEENEIIEVNVKKEELAASMKLLDKSMSIQVFNGPQQDVRDNLDIKKLKQLGGGGGSSADVYQCKIKTLPGKFVDKVRKVYNNDELADSAMEEMFQEYIIAKDLIHSNIVEYKYFMRKFEEGPTGDKNYEFHIIMELMDGEDMEVYLKEQGRPFMIEVVQQIGAQLVSAIRYLHQSKIIHQDLKPSNILFSGDYEKVKLIDLGVSNHLDKTKATRAAANGTTRYMSPEQLDGKLTFKVDIWSLGCVLLEFATGLKPFPDIQNDAAICMKIFQGQSPLDYALKKFELDCELINENEVFKKILQQCFKIDYHDRPTAENLYDLPFFNKYI